MMEYNITGSEKQELMHIESDILQEKNKVALSMLKIGDWLIRAKEILKHGQFQEWVETNVMMSYRAATNFMRAARAFPEEKRKSISCLKSTQVLLLAELPDETRDSFIIDNDISGMSTRELKAAIRKEKTDADVKRYFAESKEEQQEVFDVDVNLLKPLPIYSEYPFLRRTGKDYIDLLEYFSNQAEISPVLITKNNYVIDGAQRVRAAKDLGYSTVKAHYAYVNDYMGMTFDKICEMRFYDMKRWDFSRSSGYWFFSAFYYAVMGDEERSRHDWNIYCTKGKEIDAKYESVFNRAKAFLAEIEKRLNQGIVVDDFVQIRDEVNELFSITECD